ncbi:MAG: hypothetical protein CNIPEHKO_03141 [Anaerolineales bacterium]|nr:hypothetical protein [Anaerolineae bacterium]MBL8105318.1 hypothetical protein [Anaerolineales bacterium]MBV6402826.1 hypothetical protein [Anaerolineales bacterium]MCC7188123.1 hypothetical protein [Anaerolineales bacterium]
MTEAKRFSLVKPTAETPFHIDFEWWKKNERDWHVYLRSLLCAEHREAFMDVEEGQVIDWVDPITAEVKQVEGVQNALMSHCVKQPDFLTEQTALVEAVFRLFLTNGNIPMSSKDLGARLNRPPETILRTLAGPRVYKGIRPSAS